MHTRNSAIIIGAATLMLFGAMAAHADSDTSETLQSAGAAQAPSRLQVTGSRLQFSIEADHADIQSALKAIFAQAGKQFDLDYTVAGQLTLRLDNQPLDTVLASISRQMFIKYHLDSGTGIYHFEADTDAEKAAFTHLDTLNALLRQQLRALGVDLPGDSQLDGLLARSLGGAAGQSQNRTVLGAEAIAPQAASKSGGFGGGGGRSPAVPNTQAQSPGAVEAAGAAGSPGAQNSTLNGAAQNEAAAKTARGAASPTAPSGAYRTGVLDTGNVPDYLVEQLLQAYNLNPDRQSSVAVDKAFENYLKQNNLTAINTHGAAVPVSDVLAELSRQSGVKVLLDPLVPRGPRFRITLSMPACSLTEALNLILPPARLRWRTINDNVYVSPTPEFQIFYGSAPVPYIIYGNTSTSAKPTLSGAQGGVLAPGPNGNPK